jgi:hypothetical protein
MVADTTSSTELAGTATVIGTPIVLPGPDSEAGRCSAGTDDPPTRSATIATEVHPIEAAAAVPASQVKKKIMRLRTSQSCRFDPK